MAFDEDVTFVQAKVETVCPQAAALPMPLRTTFWPGLTVVGSVTAAIGRSATFTAPGALAIPAPQVAVLQLHSLL